MFSHLSKGRPRALFALALFAALALSAVQMLELGHYHDHGEVAESCVLCKTDGAGTAVASTSQAQHFDSGPATTPTKQPAVVSGFIAPQQARAPPLNS